MKMSYAGQQNVIQENQHRKVVLIKCHEHVDFVLRSKFSLLANLTFFVRHFSIKWRKQGKHSGQYKT